MLASPWVHAAPQQPRAPHPPGGQAHERVLPGTGFMHEFDEDATMHAFRDSVDGL